MDDERARVIFYAALVVLTVQPINVVMQLAYGLSALKPLQIWLLENTISADDSWRPMEAAWNWLHAGGRDGGLYRTIFFEQHYKFQYAPTSLLTYAALDAVGVTPDASALNHISRVFLLATSASLGILAWLLLKRAQPDAPRPILIAFAVLAAAAALVFFPLTYGYLLGQLQVWSNAFFIFSCLALALGRRALAGALLGIVCLLKPQLALFAIWGLARRDWRFLAGLVSVGALGLALSVSLFGPLNHVAYLDVLSFMSRHSEAHLSNHSISGLLHRISGNDDGLGWNNDAYPTFSPVVYAGTLITSIALIAVGIWPKRGSRIGKTTLGSFLFAAIAFTTASPIAWEPHYGVLAPAFVVLFAAALVEPLGPGRRKTLILLALAFVFSASYLPVVRVLAHTPFLILQSYLLFAALAVMIMLARQGKTIADNMAPPERIAS